MKSIYQILFLVVLAALIAFGFFLFFGSKQLRAYLKNKNRPNWRLSKTPKQNRIRTNVLFKRKAVGNNVLWIVAYCLITLICFVQIFVFFWMIMTSFKDDMDMFLDMFGLPYVNNLKFENYKKVFSLVKITVYSARLGQVEFGIWEMIANSIAIASFLPIKGIVSTVITAYVLSKYDFKLKKFLLFVNLFVIVMPSVGTLASSLKISNQFGTFDNLFMQSLLGAQPFGFSLLIYLNMFNALDKAYMEAAQLDGAGHLKIFFSIMTPMIAPTIFVFYILAVLGGWSNYEITLIWLPSYPNLARGIYEFQYNAQLYGATMPEVLAGFVIVSIPSMIFYLFNQRLIASKMIVGGLKG